MARTANPYTKVIKHLAKLQAKADKLNAEIAAFSKFVEAETKGGKIPASPVKKVTTPKVATKAKKPLVKKPVGKKAVQKPVAKRKTLAKASQSTKPPKSAKKPSVQARKELPVGDGNTNYLATLNQGSASEPVAIKGKKK